MQYQDFYSNVDHEAHIYTHNWNPLKITTSSRHIVDKMHLVVKEILQKQTLKGKNATT